MAFLPKDGENNDDESLYDKSGNEDVRLRKEYLNLVQKINQYSSDSLSPRDVGIYYLFIQIMEIYRPIFDKYISKPEVMSLSAL